MNLKFQLFFVIFLNINYIQTIPISPCPKIFQYRFDGMKWFSYLTITNPPINQPLHLKIIMSLKGKPVMNYLGEIELLSRGQYLLNEPVLYKVEFPYNEMPPKLNQIYVNNQIRCYGEPDLGFFVTIIQLEHTRKYDLLLTERAKINLKDIYDFEEYDKDIIDRTKDLISRPNKKNHFRPTQDLCGKIDGRILNSKPNNNLLKRGSWPWLAAIYVNNSTSLAYQCGGTLVSARIVISAAHCFQLFKKKFAAYEILVFLGRYNLKNWNEEGSIASPCENIFIHPDFDSTLSSYDADIAIIILKNSIRFNSYVRPSCIWSGTTNLDYIKGENGLVVGWGGNDIKISQQTSITPRKLYTTIASNWHCTKLNNKFRTLISNRTFCAITDNNNNDDDDGDSINGPCNGDSGVGLMIWHNNRWTLRGIVAATLPELTTKNYNDDSSSNLNGKSCYTNEYVIYTDVGKFLDWIYAFMF